MLVLSGSEGARSNEEKDLVVFLADNDQTLTGAGMVGFSLNEMPWTVETFEAQRQFLIASADGALARMGWDRVADFTPRPSTYDPLLTDLKDMLAGLTVGGLVPPDESWEPPRQHRACPKHRVLMYEIGGYHCIACHFEAQTNAPCCTSTWRAPPALTR